MSESPAAADTAVRAACHSPTLVINEVYRSILGESTRAGLPCTLVRLTGCGLRCGYCDTAYAFHEGEEQPLDRILGRVRELGADLVLVTGGEPLEQDGALALIDALAAAGSTVVVETGGHVDISPARAAATIVLDLKTPGSRMERCNRWENLDLLRPHDEVKFVLTSRDDYLWARQVLTRVTVRGRSLVEACPVLFSPAAGELEAAALTGWIVADRLSVRLNLQLHKILWPDTLRGV